MQASNLKKLEVRSRKSEVGSQKSEVGTQKSEVGSQKSEVRSRNSEVGSQKSELRSRNSEVALLGHRKYQIDEKTSTIKLYMNIFALYRYIFLYFFRTRGAKYASTKILFT